MVKGGVATVSEHTRHHRELSAERDEIEKTLKSKARLVKLVRDNVSYLKYFFWCLPAYS
jgi:hypothetical protein